MKLVRTFFIFGFILIFRRNAICNALVEVSTPVEKYWGSDGDAELQISANVSSTAGWDAVVVTVTGPDNRIFPATTEDDSTTAAWKIYTHTIKSLFIADAGSYTFAVENGDEEASQDVADASVVVYIYTISVMPSVANYYAVERTEQLHLSVNVKTDGDWDAVSVVLESPGGETLATAFTAMEVPFWRTYTATIENIVQGIYSFIAKETLDEKEKSISSSAIVEISEPTVIDEYLFRVDKMTASITGQIPDFYTYLYDGSDNTFILDGGNDMYDRGNYITVRTNSSETPSVPYGKPYTFKNYMFSSIASYPFTTLMWISNEDATDDMFSLQVTGQTGATAPNELAQYKSQFSTSSYSVNYDVAQVFGDAADPSICEVYFYIANEENWSSVEPSSVEFDVVGVLPNGLDNTYTVHGAPKNIMMGYMLLSRDGGKQVAESDIVKILEDVTTIIEVKDGFIMETEENDITTEESSITLITRVTTKGDWSDITVEVKIPAGSTSVLTKFTEDENARLYEYAINDLSERDSGVYAFTATDNFNFVLKSTTTLSVILAEVNAPIKEYWGVSGDAELILSVSATADDWTDATVMVTRPDGSVHKAATESTAGPTRTYTHRVTNLFIEDAGEYSFTTAKNGVTTSYPATVTVYLFTVGTYPEAFLSHSIEKESEALIMVYVACDGDWANVEGIVVTPGGSEFSLTSAPGSVPSIRIFYANITGATAGEYDVTVTETLGTRSESKSVQHTIEIHNSTHVDEYLYRIGLEANELVSYIDGWQNYWYDGPDSTFIADGGFDMYDRGNYISLSWSSGEEINIPYGKPFENDVFMFSSKNIYPFVSLLWIDNQNRSEEQFAITVEGKSGMHPTGKYETFRRILFEGTYEVTYHVFQTFESKDPSICEVYFLITNLHVWNSVLPDTFNLTIGETPPQILRNTASVTGSPSNIMLGYTLLSKNDGAKVDYLEIERVVEKYVAVLAERDQFQIYPTTEDGVYTSVANENATVEAVVSTSGKWDGIDVEMVLPSGGSEAITDYMLTNLHTQRIYQYFIPNCQYDDRGDYKFVATDKYEEREETVSTLQIFTLESYATKTQYVGGEGDTVVMEMYVTTKNYVLLAEIDTPTLGTLPVTDWTDDSTDVRTYRHKIENPTYEVDNGKYTFRITEVIYEDHRYPTTVEVDLAVFSISTSVDQKSYTANEGDEILRISVDVSTFGDWDAVQVKVMTPRRGTEEVTEFDPISDTRRNYIFEMRNVAEGDSGSYVFEATETLYGEVKSSQADSINVEVKVSEEKLTGGEIAGIVIGSVAGAALLCGLAWYCLKKQPSSTKSVSEPKQVDNDAFDLEEKSEKPNENAGITAL